MSQSPLPKTVRTITDGIDAALHIGAQLYVSRERQVIADLAMGSARPGVPMRTDTSMLWLSAGKPITGVAVAQQWERGRLELDDPVSRHIPEFGTNGKQSITIRHLLTHTAGVRSVIVDWAAAPWDQIIAAICAARVEPGWVPGHKAGYHVHSSWFVLAEIVRRLDGRAFAQYVRDEILVPCGMNGSWIGMPPEVYRALGDGIGLLQRTSPAPNAATHSTHFGDTETGAGLCRPSANTRGPIRELGLFYDMLLNRGTSARPSSRIMTSQTVEALTARHRVGMYDHTFKHVIDWGLGFILNSAAHVTGDAPYGFGPYASPRTFGHGGSQTSVGFCDPEHRLVVAILFNGAPGEAAHDRRLRAACAAVYEDLGLAVSGNDPGLEC